MKHRSPVGVTAVAVAVACVVAGAIAAPAAAQKIDLEETFRHLHRNPELSYQERETAEYLATRLRELGYETTEGVGSFEGDREPYGVVATMARGEGPTVLVRTDMDALPITEATGLDHASTVRAVSDAGDEVGVMHACGHDLHMTVFLGAAERLAAADWSGRLILVGQQAEERGAGSRALLADDLYERFGRPDAVFAIHTNAALPVGTVGVVPGWALANVDSVDLTVRGRGGHGAYPHQTFDPVTLAAQIVLNLQPIVSRRSSPFEPAVITVGSIHGGTKHNIIPDEVRMLLTVRSYEPDSRRLLLDGIREVARGTAAAAGFPDDLMPVVAIQEEEATPATWNAPELLDRVRPAIEAALGPGSLREMPPTMAGEDFSRYSLDREIPAFLFWLGAVDPDRVAAAERGELELPGLHSAGFAADPAAIPTGVDLMTAAALAVLD